jgi:hypothetical protein
MSVPEQIQRQTEAVQDLYKTLNEDPNAAPAAGGAVADSADENAQPQPGEAGSGDSEMDFEQKWRTLQGMYNAEVPRLNAQNEDLAYRLQSMEQLMSTIQSAPPPVAEAAETVSSITDADREEYGDSIDMMRKVSQDVASQYDSKITDMQNTINELRGQVVPRVDQIANQQHQSAEQSFWARLNSDVPDWQTVNNDPDFQTWLLETDPLSGMSRQTFLLDAQRNLDADRVAGFFTSWGGRAGAPYPQSQPISGAAPSELERQIAPGRGQTTAAPTGPTTRTYSQNDIQNFYTDVAQGKYKGNEEQRNTIERDIFAAQQDGRIVNA